MRVAAVVAVLGLTMASSSGHVRSIHGYGMSMALPAGWHGSIGHGYLIARGDGLTLRIDEWKDTPQDKEGFFYFRARRANRDRSGDLPARAASIRRSALPSDAVAR